MTALQRVEGMRELERLEIPHRGSREWYHMTAQHYARCLEAAAALRARAAQ